MIRNRKIYIGIVALIFSASSCSIDAVKKEEKEISNEISVNQNSPKKKEIEKDTNFHSTPKKISTSSSNLEQIEIPEDAVEKTSSSGVKISFLKEGKGSLIQKGDVVSIHYKAMLTNGKVFDASYNLGKPLAIKQGIGMQIEGLEEAMLELKVGDKVILEIPSVLAYGEKARKGIPANSDLKYELDVLSIVEPVISEKGVKCYITESGETSIKAVEGNEVVFHYLGFLKYGKRPFATSYGKEPFSFKFGTGNIMPGFHEAFQHLSLGDWAFVEIPSELGYGKEGNKDLVPPGADLIYLINVLDIK